MQKKNFGKPPVGYIPGAGRGAVGFTTRSDIGPARMNINTSQPPPGYNTDNNNDAMYNDSQFDKFSGFNENLFASLTYDANDKEADKIYKMIDEHIESRRKKQKEKKKEKHKVSRFDLYEQFKPYKKELSKVTLEEWQSIPQAGVVAKKRKSNSSRQDKFVPVPDSLIQSSRSNINISKYDMSGTESVINPHKTSLTQLGLAREKVLDMTLGKLSDSVDGQTVIDPKGYLTDMKFMSINSESDVSDINKARLLLNSITSTNPESASGWLAAARLEEHVGKFAKAKELILQGCENCPRNEDIWIEASRLHPPSDAIKLITRAITHLPKSPKIWLRAEKLEKNILSKRSILKRAIEFVPTSLDLWKSAIELEPPEGAKILLRKSVEYIPHSVDLWLALSRLEDYKNACRVLNKARSILPSESKIWIEAAKLEESKGNPLNIRNIIVKCIKSLKAHDVIIDRDLWIKDAYECEKTKFPLTCQAIVHEVLSEGIEKSDELLIWKEDAKNSLSQNKIIITRAIYAHILSLYPDCSDVWWDAIILERKNNNVKAMFDLLKESVTHCSSIDKLWLLYAKEKWKHKDLSAARKILNEAMSKNPNSESISLAAIKIEFENNNYDQARCLLKNAIKTMKDKPKIWMKYAIFERELKNDKEEKRLLKESTRIHLNYPKLFIMLGQLYEKLNKNDKAREVYEIGTKNNPKFIDLWICYSRFEEKNISIARSVLERARLKNPKNEKLWLEAVKLEAKYDASVSERSLSKAMQECPKSGILWAYAIDHEIRAKKKSKCHDALKVLTEDAYVYLSAAKIFCNERKIEKAKNWFERSIKANLYFGDSWIFYYLYLTKYGTEDEIKTLITRCASIEPRYGEKWTAISKKVGNMKLKAEDVLKLAANKLDINKL